MCFLGVCRYYTDAKLRGTGNAANAKLGAHMAMANDNPGKRCEFKDEVCIDRGVSICRFGKK
jgi:hypothetical protein